MAESTGAMAKSGSVLCKTFDLLSSISGRVNIKDVVTVDKIWMLARYANF